ncbi:MAG: hydroxymethylbilane synthase [Bergeyella sp.]|nr:hydroxymethylbilane synthase [Bergeyella sp.]
MKKIRIGSRNSPLALWQAHKVSKALEKDFTTEIIPIYSDGDKNLLTPLYEMGITGIFTKDLDVALLNDRIDLAVHSLKDVPTVLPKNIKMIACLERDFPEDVLIRRKEAKNKKFNEMTVASGSLRRRAFWLKKFPGTKFVDFRGNINTRLKKISGGYADAALFSLAGIKRLDLNTEYEYLTFILPAPSQGVITVTGHSKNTELNGIVKKIGHPPTELCVSLERLFLNALEGGCTAPIGAFAEIKEEKIKFRGALCSLDGSKAVEINEAFDLNWEENKNKGEELAIKILENGGKEILEGLKKTGLPHKTLP